MSGSIAPADGPDINRGPAVVEMAWIEVAFAITIVGLRLCARGLQRTVGWDDWTMLFSVMIFIVWGSLTTVYASLGGFRHLEYLATTGANTEEVIYYNYLIQFVTTFLYAPAKTSVAILVLRLMGPSSAGRHRSWRKWVIYVTLVCVWITTILYCVVAFAQCSPAAALWNPSIPHSCWDPTIAPKIALASGAVNTVSDAILAFIPATLVYNLNMELKKRINLCVILGLGIVAAICGIVKMNYLRTLGAHSDITWETYNLIVWSGSELFVLIFCGSIPPLKGLWDRLFGKGTGYYSQQHELTDPNRSQRRLTQKRHSTFARDGYGSNAMAHKDSRDSSDRDLGQEESIIKTTKFSVSRDTSDFHAL